MEYDQNKTLRDRLGQDFAARLGDRRLDRSTPLSVLVSDSLDLIEGLFELEQRFGKTLSNAELRSLETLGDLIAVFGADRSCRGETVRHGQAKRHAAT